MASEQQKPQAGEEESSWGGDFNPFADPEERRVLFAAFDSFRYVGRQLIPTHVFLGL
jgi:carnosine N-methyltransferase